MRESTSSCVSIVLFIVRHMKLLFAEGCERAFHLKFELETDDSSFIDLDKMEVTVISNDSIRIRYHNINIMLKPQSYSVVTEPDLKSSFFGRASLCRPEVLLAENTHPMIMFQVETTKEMTRIFKKMTLFQPVSVNAIFVVANDDILAPLLLSLMESSITRISMKNTTSSDIPPVQMNRLISKYSESPPHHVMNAIGDYVAPFSLTYNKDSVLPDLEMILSYSHSSWAKEPEDLGGVESGIVRIVNMRDYDSSNVYNSLCCILDYATEDPSVSDILLSLPRMSHISKNLAEEICSSENPEKYFLDEHKINKSYLQHLPLWFGPGGILSGGLPLPIGTKKGNGIVALMDGSTSIPLSMIDESLSFAFEENNDEVYISAFFRLYDEILVMSPSRSQQLSKTEWTALQASLKGIATSILIEMSQLRYLSTSWVPLQVFKNLQRYLLGKECLKRLETFSVSLSKPSGLSILSAQLLLRGDRDAESHFTSYAVSRLLSPYVLPVTHPIALSSIGDAAKSLLKKNVFPLFGFLKVPVLHSSCVKDASHVVLHVHDEFFSKNNELDSVVNRLLKSFIGSRPSKMYMIDSSMILSSLNIQSIVHSADKIPELEDFNSPGVVILIHSSIVLPCLTSFFDVCFDTSLQPSAVLPPPNQFLIPTIASFPSAQQASAAKTLNENKSASFCSPMKWKDSNNQIDECVSDVMETVDSKTDSFKAVLSYLATDTVWFDSGVTSSVRSHSDGEECLKELVSLTKESKKIYIDNENLLLGIGFESPFILKNNKDRKDESKELPKLKESKKCDQIVQAWVALFHEFSSLLKGSNDSCSYLGSAALSSWLRTVFSPACATLNPSAILERITSDLMAGKVDSLKNCLLLFCDIVHSTCSLWSRTHYDAKLREEFVNLKEADDELLKSLINIVPESINSIKMSLSEGKTSAIQNNVVSPVVREEKDFVPEEEEDGW